MPSIALLPSTQVSTHGIAPEADDEVRGHHARLGHLAEALGRHLGLDADAAQLLRLAAPLHDVGASVPAGTDERCLNPSPPDRVTALLGGSRLPLFRLAAEIALNHHERWDGSGGPAGLRGEAIPLSARIVAVVDCFDSLTLRRRFRPARADDRALSMLTAQAGIAFDPRVVATFLTHAPALIALRDRIDATRHGGCP